MMIYTALRAVMIYHCLDTPKTLMRFRGPRAFAMDKKSSFLRTRIFGRGSRTRTHDQRFWRPRLYQLSYTPIKVAIRMGLEPTTSSVTGWRSNQLNYRTTFVLAKLPWNRITQSTEFVNTKILFFVLILVLYRRATCGSTKRKRLRPQQRVYPKKRG